MIKKYKLVTDLLIVDFLVGNFLEKPKFSTSKQNIQICSNTSPNLKNTVIIKDEDGNVVTKHKDYSDSIIVLHLNKNYYTFNNGQPPKETSSFGLGEKVVSTKW